MLSSERWEGSEQERWERWEDSKAAKLDSLDGSDVASWERWGGQVGSEEVARWQSGAGRRVVN